MEDIGKVVSVRHGSRVVDDADKLESVVEQRELIGVEDRHVVARERAGG
jgi:hypothetical protein